jgi:hypothetical protein
MLALLAENSGLLTTLRLADEASRSSARIVVPVSNIERVRPECR